MGEERAGGKGEKMFGAFEGEGGGGGEGGRYGGFLFEAALV